MPPAAIDKCLAKSDVLAGVIVAKYQDSLPLYRQEAMFRREGVTISRQTMCGWMSKCAFNLRPIVAHMGTEILAGPAAFLAGFSGTLQVDGYAGYNLAQKTGGLVRAGCWAHVRRKFEQSLHTEKGRAATVLLLIQKLYQVEREIRQKSPMTA